MREDLSAGCIDRPSRARFGLCIMVSSVAFAAGACSVDRAASPADDGGGGTLGLAGKPPVVAGAKGNAGASAGGMQGGGGAANGGMFGNNGAGAPAAGTGNTGTMVAGAGASLGGTSSAGGSTSVGGAGMTNTGGTGLGGSGAGASGTAGAALGGRSAGGGSGAALGGSPGVAGVAGIGGIGGAAGSADPPCPASTPLTGGKQYCGSSGDGTADGSYTYNLWSDGKGMGCMTVYGVDAAFRANWTDVGDWIGRVGLAFDKTKTYDQIGTFSSDFAYTLTGITTGGFGNIGIYGWTVSPLHEYYIAENWLGKKPNFTKVATFTIEGEGTYDVMTNQQKNQPNITGTNQDFVQYWSVRSSPRQCGHVSISKHFEQWKSLGLELGKLEEVRILVEAQNNSGTLDFTKATVVVK